MQNLKKTTLEKINAIDQMLHDLNIYEADEADMQNDNPKINSDGLDVLDVLHSILTNWKSVNGIK
jgi:hypothetical protein